jgi:uncharacterized protein YdhG (YjbR/CyaY superfamily)
MKKAKNVDEYIAGFPAETGVLLTKLRAAVKEAAPMAEEIISYGMPAYKLKGRLLYFAAFSKHIGFYPMPSGIREFREQIAKYKFANGSVQFPLDKPLPVTLITKIVKFRVKENMMKAELKKQKKVKPEHAKK